MISKNKAESLVTLMTRITVRLHPLVDRVGGVISIGLGSVVSVCINVEEEFRHGHVPGVVVVVVVVIFYFGEVFVGFGRGRFRDWLVEGGVPPTPPPPNPPPTWAAINNQSNSGTYMPP